MFIQLRAKNPYPTVRKLILIALMRRRIIKYVSVFGHTLVLAQQKVYEMRS